MAKIILAATLVFLAVPAFAQTYFDDKGDYKGNIAKDGPAPDSSGQYRDNVDGDGSNHDEAGNMRGRGRLYGSPYGLYGRTSEYRSGADRDGGIQDETGNTNRFLDGNQQPVDK